MKHGFLRRLSFIEHCAEKVFELVPPDCVDPTQDALRDTSAFLHSFIINTFGAIDNLAWLWVREAQIVDGRGRDLNRSRVGLTPGHEYLRGTLSDVTRDYLATTDGWFAYLEEYRHALAHRIPLYIPPKQLTELETQEFRRLDSEVGGPGWDWARWPEILAAQRRLGVFQPLMMHSFGEGAQPIRFHAQIGCDFATVIEIGEHVLRDIRALRQP